MPPVVAAIIGVGAGATATVVAGASLTTAIAVGTGAAIIAHETGVAEDVYDNIVVPVADAIGDTIDYIVDNPIEAIVTLGTTILAPYAAPLLGVAPTALTAAATWAIPLANGAQTLVDGGSFEDALQDAALSYVAQSVGTTIGDFASNQASRVVTSTLGDTAVTNTVASVLGAGSKAASTAVVYGQNPVEAFKNGALTSAVGATLGYVDTKITEATGGLTGWEDLQDGVKNTIYSGIAAEISGTDFTALDAVTALDSDGFVSKIAEKYSSLGTWMSDFAKANTNLTDRELTLVGDALNRAATVALNGNPELSGEAFFASLQEPAYEELKDLINDPLENALDNISGTWDDTVAATAAYNEKLTEAQGYADTINTAVGRYKEILDGQDVLIKEYNDALAKFNGNKTQANADAVGAIADRVEKYVSENESEIATLLKTIDDTRPLYDAANGELPALEAEYNKQSGFLITDVEDFTDEVTPVLQGAEKTAALALSGGIDADAYAEINSIEADEVYAHYLSRGQNLPTQERFLENNLDGMRQRALAEALSAAGYSELDLLSANNGAYEAALGVFEDNLNTFVDFTSADYEDLVDRAITAANEVSGNEIKSYSLANGVTGADVASGAASLVTIDGKLQYAFAEQVAEAFGGKVVTTTSDSQFSNNPNTMRIEITTYQATGDGTYRNTDTGEVVDNATGAVDDGQPAVTLPRMITNALSTDTFGASLTKQVLDLGSSAGNVLDNTVDAPVYDTSLNLYRLMMGSDYGISGGITATGNETYDNIGAVVSKGGADMLNAINGLAVLALDADPDGPLVDKANRMLALSNSLMSDDFRGAVKDMDFIMANSGEGWKGAAQGVFGAFSAYPAQFLGYYVGSELVQEVPLMLAAAVAGSAATGAAAAAVTTQWARRIGTAVGIGTDVALNAAEAAGATAQSSYEEAYSVAMGTGKYTEDQAKEYALGIAENAAGIALYAAAVTGGWGSELSQKYFKSNEAKDAFQALTQKLNDGTEVFVKEGQAESIEEALPQLYTATELVQLDPTIDVSKQVTGAALMGGIIGSTVSGTIYSGNAIADTLYNLNRDVRNAVDSSTSTQDLQAKLGALGIDDASVQGSIANYKYDGDFSTINEVKAGFEAANPDFDYSDVNLDSYLNTKDADLAAEVASYVDPRFLDAEEVKAAAAAEGITLTDEQAAAYVGQKDEADAIAEIAAEYDPQYTSRGEAIEMMRELGFDTSGPYHPLFGAFKNIRWRTNLADTFKGKTEAEALEAIEAYVDPRMFTEDEARASLEAEGYTPTQAEVDALVGQDYNENYQADAEAEVIAYVDPRQVTDAEARQFFADLGYTPTDQEIADFTAQVSETEQQTAISEYVDPRFVTLDEVQAIADQEGLTLTEALAATYLGQRDEASALEAAQGEFDPLATTFDEAKQFFEAQGYTPTTEEVAQFVASATEEAQQSGVAEYVDPRQVTEAESKAFLEALGYTPTDEEVASFAGQLNDATYQTSQETAVGEYVDPRQVTAEEATQFFEDLGYTPTEEQIADFTAQVAETEQQSAISKYVDPRQVTMAEVQAIADQEGLTLTEALAATYIGQSEADTFQQEQLDAARAEYDPLATTLEEATQFFADTGYNATTEEIAEFVASKTEEAQTSAIGAYVDPRQVTAAEAEEFLTSIGYQPTQEEIDSFVGQVNDENYQVTQQAKIDEYTDPRMFDAGEVRAAYEELGLVDVTQEDVDRFVGQFDPESEDYDPAGFEAYQRERVRDYMPAATFNVIKQVLGSPAVEDNPNTPEDESKEATGIYAEFEAGATRDEALDAAIQKVAEDLGTTKTDLLGELGLTEERLGNEIDALAEDIGGIEEDIGGLEEDIGGLEEDIGGISDILGKPAVADDPDTEVDESQDPTGLFATIDAYEKAGMERDEALELAIGEVASALGTTETNLLDAIGTSKTDILGELETGLGALEESLGGDIDNIASIIGKPAQEVTQVDIDFVADVIAQNQVLDELQTAQYDVTGDGIVDINDQNLLNSALQGEDVTFADTSMFGPATGLYGVIGDVQQDVQSQIDQQTDTITDLVTDLNTQIDTESKRRNLSDLTQMLMSAEDLGGQRVSVRTPDPVRLNYLYDFNSIFANPSQASLFASPFGGTRAQPANAPRAPMGAGLMNTGPMGPMGMAAGFAEGGAVDETDELLRILGEME